MKYFVILDQMIYTFHDTLGLGQAGREYIANNHFQNRATGVELVADNDHVGNDERQHGEIPSYRTETTLDNLWDSIRLDVSRTSRDKRQQEHADECGDWQQHRRHPGLVSLLRIANDRTGPNPDR